MADRETHIRVWRGLQDLQVELRPIVDREPEQDVQRSALLVLDAVLEEAKVFLEGDPVVERAEDVISPEAVAAGEVIRAVDVLLVVTMLLSRVERPPTDIEFKRTF